MQQAKSWQKPKPASAEQKKSRAACPRVGGKARDSHGDLQQANEPKWTQERSKEMPP